MEIPTPSQQAGLKALSALLMERHPLAAMQVFHAEMGDVFRINLPGFKPVVMVGPQAAHFVLVEGRHELRWRNENDPVVRLLRHGVLVEDGEQHDHLRRLMNPSLHRRMLDGYIAAMVSCTDQVTANWKPGEVYPMLDEMRKIALLILTRTLFRVDYTPEMKRLWSAVLGVIGYISPGVWMLWSGFPRPQYSKAIRRMDEYLQCIISLQRAELQRGKEAADDLLSALLLSGMDDELARDQLLTMLIAGHDTSTALLAWTLALLGQHPDWMSKVREEVMGELGDNPPTPETVNRLETLRMVTQEALRLYPPIHLGSRLAASELYFNGYRIPQGERVIYSIYLTQRHPAYWDNPNEFTPERHAAGRQHTPYSWLAFGGGPRNCIGAAFGQVEAKTVLARVFQRFELELLDRRIHPHMGATLEPRPGVRMRVRLSPLTYYRSSVNLPQP